MTFFSNIVSSLKQVYIITIIIIIVTGMNMLV